MEEKTKTDYVITAQDLSFRFGEKRVLEHVSFEIPRGEIFGLLGPSGAGKTTLVKLLTGQLRQDGGSAELFGRDTRRLGAAEHGRIGTMMECFGLYDRLSVYDNLLFYADIYHVSRDSIPALLKSIGLFEARRTAVSGLSRGMKNRLSLARTLMNGAEALFLDEPTSGLDPAVTREIHAVLAERRESGTTIFLTTHNMYEAEKLCGRVALLNGGSIIECGRPEELRRKYNRRNQLCVRLRSGETALLNNGPAAALPLKGYLERGEVEAIHSTEPTLESIFIELTGKGLD